MAGSFPLYASCCRPGPAHPHKFPVPGAGAHGSSASGSPRLLLQTLSCAGAERRQWCTAQHDKNLYHGAVTSVPCRPWPPGRVPANPRRRGGPGGVGEGGVGGKLGCGARRGEEGTTRVQGRGQGQHAGTGLLMATCGVRRRRRRRQCTARSAQGDSRGLTSAFQACSSGGEH